METGYAMVMVDLDGVRLYKHGDPNPEIIPLDELYRITVSLRDAGGPCVWLERRPKPPPSPEPSQADPDQELGDPE
jgi:hypothetical protein